MAEHGPFDAEHAHRAQKPEAALGREGTGGDGDRRVRVHGGSAGGWRHAQPQLRRVLEVLRRPGLGSDSGDLAGQSHGGCSADAGGRADFGALPRPQRRQHRRLTSLLFPH